MTPKKAAASPPILLTTMPAAAAVLEADVVAALAVLEAPPAAAEELPLTADPDEAVVPLLELPEVLTTAVVDVAVAVVDMLVRVMALYCAQRELPIATTLPSSVALQALSRHGSTRVPILLCVGPHWQAWSFAAQPAAETADAMQAVAHGSSAVRVCAVARERMAEMVMIWNFMVLTCIDARAVVGLFFVDL
jgi:hypothetical protein